MFGNDEGHQTRIRRRKKFFDLLKVREDLMQEDKNV
jgi:hypothetical protein